MEPEKISKFKKLETKYKTLKKEIAAEKKAEKIKAAIEIEKAAQRKNNLILQFVLDDIQKEGVDISTYQLKSGATISQWLQNPEDRKLFNLEVGGQP